MIDDRVDDKDDNNITRVEVEGRFHLRQAGVWRVHCQVNYLKEAKHIVPTHSELKTCFSCTAAITSGGSCFLRFLTARHFVSISLIRLKKNVLMSVFELL